MNLRRNHRAMAWKHPRHVRGTSADGPWQISAMALLCVMGLLVGFFLHLVQDSSEKQNHHHSTRSRASRVSPTKKKKTDEWSSDEHVEEEDAYTADTESLYYPYHPRYWTWQATKTGRHTK